MGEFLKINWDPKIVSKVFTIETEEKTRTDAERKQIFERTHIPINKIKVENATVEFQECIGKKELEFIDEAEFSKYLEDFNDGEKRVIIIKGGVGSGKSELAESINYNFLVHKKIIPIIFPRSEVSLKDIFDKLNNKFKLNLQYKSLLKYELRTITDYILNQSDMLIQDIRDSSSEVFKNLIRNKDSILILSKLVSLRSSKENMRNFLKKSLEIYLTEIKNHGDLTVEFNLDLSIEEFIKVQFHINNSKKLTDIRQDIELVIRKVIHDYQDIPPFNEIVEDIYNLTKNDKRILFIFEDATGFGFAENLINFAFDRSLKPCDIIIAWTDGYIQEKNIEATNYRQRTQLVLSLSDNIHSFFLNDDSILKMAKNYLDTLKYLSKDSIDAQLQTEFEEIEKIFDGLYPFNENCLLRIYHNLLYESQEKKTPRIFLAYALRSILTKKRIPEFNEPTFFKIPKGYMKGRLEREFSQFFSIAYLYGEPNDEKLKINLNLCKFLGFNLSEKLKNELIGTGAEFLSNGDVLLTLTRPMKKLKYITTVFDDDDDNNITIDSEIEDEFEIATEDFYNWLNGSRLGKRNELERGLKNLFNFFTNKNFGTFNSFSYTGVFMDIDTEQVNRPEIRIFIPKESNADLEILELALLKIGVLKRNLGDLVIKPNFNLMNSTAWVKSIKDQLEEKFNKKLNSILNLDFYQLIILLKGFIVFLNLNKRKLEYKDLIKSVSSIETFQGNILSKCPNCSREIEDFACSSCKIIVNPTIPLMNIKDISEFFLSVNKIFDRLFKISNDFYNFPLLTNKFNSLTGENNLLNMDVDVFNHLRNLRSVEDERMEIILNSQNRIKIKNFIVSLKKVIGLFDNGLSRYNLRHIYQENTSKFLKYFEGIDFKNDEMNLIETKINEMKKISTLSNFDSIQNFDFSMLNSNFHQEFEDINIKWNKFISEGNQLDFFEINSLFLRLSKFFKVNFNMYKEINKINICEEYLNQRLSSLSVKAHDIIRKLHSYEESEKRCIDKFNLLREAIKNEQ